MAEIRSPEIPKIVTGVRSAAFHLIKAIRIVDDVENFITETDPIELQNGAAGDVLYENGREDARQLTKSELAAARTFLGGIRGGITGSAARALQALANASHGF